MTLWNSTCKLKQTEISEQIYDFCANGVSVYGTWLDSGRHECCWPGTRTNFSISWFNPSTELRIGRCVAHDRGDLGGIDTGLAAIYNNTCIKWKKHSITIDALYSLCIGLNVCELTECSPVRCWTRCNLCRITFSDLFANESHITSTFESMPTKQDSSVCVALSRCKIV